MRRFGALGAWLAAPRLSYRTYILAPYTVCFENKIKDPATRWATYILYTLSFGIQVRRECEGCTAIAAAP